MHDHEKLIEKFYSSFRNLDADGMVDCYHSDIVFSDPVFPNLQGEFAGGMWQMLCGQAKDFQLTYGDISADEKKGKAHWEAQYDFSLTGRTVHNKIDAEFEFKDGKMIRHTDSFVFLKWSQMLLGLLFMPLAGDCTYKIK